MPLSIKLAYKKSIAVLQSLWLRIVKFLTFLKKNGNGEDKSKLQHEFDQKLVYSVSKSRIPNFKQLSYLKRYLSKTELWLLRGSLAVILLSLSFAGVRFYLTHLEIVPIAGGTYIEAVVGLPNHINPLYANMSDVDSDLSRLIFSSLFKRGRNNELVKDLVDTYEISDDGKVYSFTIRTDALWHNGAPLTVDDIIFTFNAIKDAQYQSTLRMSFGGVTVERVDDTKINFVLSDPYAAFLELMTFGIIPADSWSQIPPESAGLAALNLKPIGSGPYVSGGYTKDSMGKIKEYKLEINNDYYGPKPKINIVLRFYQSFDEAISALNNGQANGLSYLPQNFKDLIITPKAYNYHKLYFPQLTAIFFNEVKNKVLADKNVRQALAYAIDRNSIINEILGGEAYIVDSPVLASSFAYNPDIKKYDFEQKKAKELLDNIDWKETTISPEDIVRAEADALSDDEKVSRKAEQILAIGEGTWRIKDGNYLVVNLKTIERYENNRIVEAIKGYWEKIGVKTDIATVSLSRMQSEILKTRDYETLFYAQIVGADPDPYAFWHSSQASEDGYNIANYKNKDVDKLLEDARLISDLGERQKLYKEFQRIFSEELPAFYIYSPFYTYIQRNDVKGFNVKDILYPSDRFSNINDWYLKVGKRLNW